MRLTPSPAAANHLADKDRLYLPVLLLILLASLVLRLLILREFLQHNPFSEVFYSDAYVYWITAAGKAAGAWVEKNPFLQAPLYPYLLALIRWFTDELPVVFTLQLFLGLASVILVAEASRIRFGSPVALLATLLFAFASEPVMSFTRVLADTLQLFLACLVWWLWVSLEQRRSASWLLLSATAFSIGLLALAWSPAQLMLPVFVIAMMWRPLSLPVRLLSAALALLIGILTLLPATLHNYHVSGDVIPVSSNGGINLYQGNKPGAVGIVTPIPGMRTAREHMFLDIQKVYYQETGEQGSWQAIDRHFRDKAIDYALKHPAEMGLLLLRKLDWFLTSMHYDNVSSLKLEQELGLYTWSHYAPIHLPWLMGAAILGLILLLREPRVYLPEWTILGTTLLVCLVFYFSGRFRLPAAPILCSLSALSLLRLRQLPANAGLQLGLILLPVLLLWINHQTGMTSVDFDRERNRLRVAHAYLEVGDLRAYEGRWNEAQEQYLLAAQSDPGYPAPFTRLAHLQRLQFDDPDTALAYARQGIDGHTDSVSALRLAYNLSLDSEDYAAALEMLEALIARQPQELPLQQARLLILSACPDPSVRDPQRALALVDKLYHNSPVQRRPAIAMARAMVLQQAGQSAAAAAEVSALIELLKGSGSSAGIAVLERLRQDIIDQRPLPFDPIRFQLDNPWSQPHLHPMRR